MTPEERLQTIRHELEAGIELTKCQQCGCMEDTLKQLASVLPTIGTHGAILFGEESLDGDTRLHHVKHGSPLAHGLPKSTRSCHPRTRAALGWLHDAGQYA